MFPYGVDYYPEHRPRARWAEDARRMKGAGLNLVRMAEFAWAKLEPVAGQYDWEWLDEAIEKLHNEGIRTVLGTPTAVPPNWMVQADPTILPVDRNGLRRNAGGRRHYCVNHPGYRAASVRIAQAIATRYKVHPAVIGWQIDNEFGCHDTARCYCVHCDRAFQRWLQDRYESLDHLNEAWGTVFWSATFQDWGQVRAPRTVVAQEHPSLMLDFRRFASDSNVGYQRLQVEAIRSVNPAWWVTHNLMGLFPDLDYYDLATDLDFVSWDNYYGPHPPVAAISHDLMRSVKPGKNFWVMEQQCGQVNWKEINELARPGQIRLWAWQGIAHGADGMVYFRWDACRFGQELYHSGLIDHADRETRAYREVAQVGSELAKLPDLHGSRNRAEVALLWDYDQLWAMQIQPHQKDYCYERELAAWHQAFAMQGIPVDFAHPRVDLSRYKLVVAPAVQVVDAVMAANLERYVADGGLLIGGPRLGVRDHQNVVFDSPAPGPLARLFGVTVTEFDAVPSPGQPVLWDLPHPVDRRIGVALTPLDGAEFPGALWADLLEVQGASVLGSYTSQFYAGVPAMTRNRWSKGAAVYLGTSGEQIQAAVAFWGAQEAGVSPLVSAVSAGADVQQRGDYLFVLNPTEEEQWVELRAPGVDRLTEERLSGRVELPPFAVRIITV